MGTKAVIIGYSGHAMVAVDIMLLNQREIFGYCENEEKQTNPYKLRYLGSEQLPSNIKIIEENSYFVGIGSNPIRKKVVQKIGLKHLINVLHPSAVIASTVTMGNGILVAANVSINPFAQIGTGVICNTGCIIEHECEIGDFAHIAPGSVLAGNVKVGAGTFVGANAVVKQGITIGTNVTVGAGTVVIKDIPSGTTVVGNPGRIIKKK